MYNLQSPEHMKCVAMRLDMTYNAIWKMKTKTPLKYTLIAKGVFIDDLDFESLEIVCGGLRDVIKIDRLNTVKGLL